MMVEVGGPDEELASLYSSSPRRAKPRCARAKGETGTASRRSGAPPSRMRAAQGLRILEVAKRYDVALRIERARVVKTRLPRVGTVA
jgi:hypothetical protein